MNPYNEERIARLAMVNMNIRDAKELFYAPFPWYTFNLPPGFYILRGGKRTHISNEQAVMMVALGLFDFIGEDAKHALERITHEQRNRRDNQEVLHRT